jgi:hypothetical protein
MDVDFNDRAVNVDFNDRTVDVDFNDRAVNVDIKDRAVNVRKKHAKVKTANKARPVDISHPFPIALHCEEIVLIKRNPIMSQKSDTRKSITLTTDRNLLVTLLSTNCFTEGIKARI